MFIQKNFNLGSDCKTIFPIRAVKYLNRLPRGVVQSTSLKVSKIRLSKANWSDPRTDLALSTRLDFRLQASRSARAFH